jgi:hypothetical protein
MKRKKYTLKQIRRENPLAAELINKYLDGKVPSSLRRHNYPQNTVSIYPVLPNPVDLGLIPPASHTPPPSYHDIGNEFGQLSMMGSDCSPSTCEKGKRHKRHRDDAAYAADDAADDAEMIKLFISDKRD